MQEAARRNLTAKAWAYMKSGATDERSESLSSPSFRTSSNEPDTRLTYKALSLNRNSYNSILFRPRTLIDVEECNTSCEMMGESTSLPIFISPAGMAGLAHPLAEKGLAEAAGVCGIIQMVRP